MRNLFLIALIAISALSTSRAQADVRIDLNFTWVFREAQSGAISRNTEHAAYVLHDGNKVSRMFNNTFHDGNVGTRVNLTSDRKYVSQISFRNGTIDELVPFSTHIFHTVIRTDGTSSCEAKKTVRLKPGQKLFRDWAGSTPIVATEMHAEDVSCSISVE